MKITVLLENTACSPEFVSAHGLSLLLETQEKKVLFDMGPDASFADNAEKLGVDLTQVDFAVLSHGHYDHGGGLQTFLEINDKAPVYINKNAFGLHYHGQEKYIGLDPNLIGSKRFCYVDDVLALSDTMTLFSCNDKKLRFKINPYGLTMRKENVFYPENFIHEQYLLVQEGERRILISGCSHKGILNLAAWFKPDVLVGGFHFMKETNPVFLQEAAKELLSYPTVYYTGHCTGQEQYQTLKQIMGERLQPITTGLIMEI